MEHITSRHNPLMGHIRKLVGSAAYRWETGEFLCDSPKLLQEALLWQAEITAAQQRIDQTVQQARHEAEMRAWDEYVRVSGAKSVEDVPPRVAELVTKEHMTPVAAHWRYMSEQAQQQVEIEKKNNQNRQMSPGSMTGREGDTSDPFLRGLLGL